MERSAATDDLVTCPNCHIRDHLLIRWIPDIDHRVHERTEVGCTKCNIWFTAKEDKWCFAEWNVWACEKWAQSGHRVPHAELYRLLQQEAREEQIERTAAKAVSRYLAEHIASQCPLVAGDRFESKQEPKGFWSVMSIEAVYGINTGPFCIIKASNVRPSGILGDTTHEFWSHESKLQKIRPFWKPSEWRQVKVGDACILNEKDGVILHSDISARRAVVNIDGAEFEVHKLSELLIPVVRVEENGIVQPCAQAGLRKSAQPLSFTLAFIGGSMKDQSKFRKSSFSSERSLFSRCVEVAIEDDRVLVRHSRQNATVIEFTHDEWTAFILGVKHKEFDLPE